ncbi:hypothetical protein [Streptococcus iniae]|uniref:hypothetical protein n=1 Tax=Streptococcus iniae TaxID=1346 RepID=UPI00160509BB|nr:hypothetical protein [Streptococcus iniae]
MNAINTIYLGTVSIFESAQAFYKNQDFQIIAKDQLPKDFPLMPIDNTFFQCELI